MDFNIALKNLNSGKTLPAQAIKTIAKIDYPPLKWSKESKTSAFVEIGKALCQLNIKNVETDGYIDLDKCWANIGIQDPTKPNPDIHSLAELMVTLCDILGLDKAGTTSFINAWTPIISKARDEYSTPFGGCRAYMVKIAIIQNTPEYHLNQMGKLYKLDNDAMMKWYQESKTKSGLKDIKDPFDWQIISQMFLKPNNPTDKKYFYFNSEPLAMDCCQYQPKKENGFSFKITVNWLKFDKQREEWKVFRVSGFTEEDKMIAMNHRFMESYTGPMEDGMWCVAAEFVESGQYWNMKGFFDLWN